MKLTDEQAEDALDRVESALGMAHGAWDMVSRMSIFRAIEAEVLRLNGITGDGRGEAKYFFYCRANTHNDSECWSTRPAGWKPDNTAQTAATPLVPSPSVKFVWPPAQPQQQQAAPGAVPDGYALAMAVLQSDLYNQLDDLERAQCDAMLSAAPKPQEPV